MTGHNKGEMTFLQHLEELRWHIIRSFAAILAAAIAAFIFKDIVFDKIIFGPRTPDFFTNKMLCKLGELINSQKLCINTNSNQLQNIHMTGQFLTHIKISIIAGIIMAFPYIFYEFWRFVNPALYEKERKISRGAVFYSSSLFLLGVLFGYYVISPLSVHFLENYRVSEKVVNEINLMSYISIIATIVLASGILFELPVVIYFLSKIGIVTPEFLKKYRKHSIIVILALSAIITPPDVFSQILVSFPLIALYEISISISRRIYRKQEQENLAG
jgi:sec-independent protein translocase protein TatC